MEWKFIDKYGKNSTIPTSRQIDTVGNVMQINGAVQPYACQKCNKVFSGKVEAEPIEQNMPLYKCNDCDFESNTGDKAFDHMLESEHKLNKTTTKRIVGVNITLKGDLSHIIKENDDVLILCEDCQDGSR